MQLQLKKIVGRFFLLQILQICLPPFSRRRLIMDIKTPQYEKIQVGFPRPSFYNNKGEFFLSKKSESKPIFHTLRFNISQFAKMSPRLELFFAALMDLPTPSVCIWDFTVRWIKTTSKDIWILKCVFGYFNFCLQAKSNCKL